MALHAADERFWHGHESDTSARFTTLLHQMARQRGFESEYGRLGDLTYTDVLCTDAEWSALTTGVVLAAYS